MTMRELLYISEPQMGITPASQVTVRPITGNLLTYIWHRADTNTCHQYFQIHYLCSSAPSIFLFLKSFHSSHLWQVGPIFKIQIKFPVSGKPASLVTLECTDLGLHSEPHSSAALIWQRIRSLILWFAISYHSYQKASFKEGLANVFESLTTRLCSW